MQKVNLVEKLSLFTDHWKPKIVGELNGQEVKLVKFQGEFVWHRHEAQDELFLAVRGGFRMDYKDDAGEPHSIEIAEGELIVVPRGVEHRPAARSEVAVLLFEPAVTLNTGDVRGALTAETLERI